MNIWKKVTGTLTVIAALGCGAHALAAEGPGWDKAKVDTTDQTALQNGASTFITYCLGCHSAAYMRYNRLLEIGFTEQQLKDGLMPTTEKVGDTMLSTIDQAQGKALFGNPPPDLTVIARSRAGEGGSGADYLYTLLRSFYRDPTKATGWNNTTFPSIAMPNPFWQLQGERSPQYEAHPVEGGKPGETEQVFTGHWKQVSPGAMNEQQFDQTVHDLVTYLQWMGEPAQNKRVTIGIWVMIYLLIFAFVAWKLNAAYWKDVK